MAERTYLYGYKDGGPWGSAGRKTRDEILVSGPFDHVHRELMRRLFALADWVIDHGSDFGFGGGDREFAQQDAEFRRRHYIAPSGIWFYDGHWWQRYSWAAPYAPPGNSWHEAGASTGGALAVDALGNHLMATPMCSAFGLVNGISGEPWHYQPVEIPHARTYQQVWGPLAVWPLPTEPEDDMKALPTPKRAYDSRPTEQAGVDPTLANANAAVPKTPFKPGEQRGIVVGMVAEVFVHVTVIGTAPGFVEVAGRSFTGPPTTSLANVDQDGVTSGGGPVATPEGKVYVWATSACDIAIDIRATG